MTRTDQKHRWLAVGAIIFASVTLHESGHAQAREREFAVAVVGGPFQYDLSGTGTSVFGALRFDLPLRRWLIVEPGLTLAQYEPQFGSRVWMVFPEVQLQASGTGDVRPFLGVGLGPALAWSRGASDTQLALSAALGFRIRLTSEWRARAELRVRAIDPFAGTIAEWGFGFARTF